MAQSQVRELKGQKWLLSRVWDKEEKRTVWEVKKWGFLEWFGRAEGGWQYWGHFGTLGEWKQAVEKGDFDR